MHDFQLHTYANTISSKSLDKVLISIRTLLGQVFKYLLFCRITRCTISLQTFIADLGESTLLARIFSSEVLSRCSASICNSSRLVNECLELGSSN